MCIDGKKLSSYLTYILLLLLTQRELNEDLLKLLIAIVDYELLKAVVLWDKPDAA